MPNKLTIQEMNRLSVDEYRQADKLPLRVVLDNVRSQHNVGAVFRTADAFRLEGVDLCGICCCPPDREIHKTALGAEESVPWTYHQDTMDCIRALHEQGYTLLAIEQAHHSVTLDAYADSLSRLSVCPKLAIILGHEVFGVQQQVVDAADRCIEIPQYGTKHSLNVSVTAGIVMYTLSHALRQLPA